MTCVPHYHSFLNAQVADVVEALPNGQEVGGLEDAVIFYDI